MVEAREQRSMSRSQVLRRLLPLASIAVIVLGTLGLKAVQHIVNQAEISISGAVTADFKGPVAHGTQSGAPGDPLSGATAECEFGSADLSQVDISFPSEGRQWFLTWRSVSDPIVGRESQVRLATPGYRGFRNIDEFATELNHQQSRLYMKLDHVRLLEFVPSQSDQPVVGTDTFVSLSFDFPC
jgi:hypothetical protein